MMWTRLILALLVAAPLAWGGSRRPANRRPGKAGWKNLIANADFSDGLKHWKVEFPEPNETKYSRNHEHIKIVPAPNRGGNAIKFTLSGGVAASEGVKAVTEMMPIEQGTAYEFGADVFSEGPAPIIFVEGYQEDPEREDVGDNQYKGFVRVYRATIHVKNAGGKWASQLRAIKPPPTKRHQPTHILIKLYAYWPKGQIHFANAFLRRTDEANVKTRKKK